jgi:hypothetical protein
VSTLGFEQLTLSANDKHAKPLDHAAAPRDVGMFIIFAVLVVVNLSHFIYLICPVWTLYLKGIKLKYCVPSKLFKFLWKIFFFDFFNAFARVLGDL